MSDEYARYPTHRLVPWKSQPGAVLGKDKHEKDLNFVEYAPPIGIPEVSKMSEIGIIG
jgi:hypothetical protein